MTAHSLVFSSRTGGAGAPLLPDGTVPPDVIRTARAVAAARLDSLSPAVVDGFVRELEEALRSESPAAAACPHRRLRFLVERRRVSGTGGRGASSSAGLSEHLGAATARSGGDASRAISTPGSLRRAVEDSLARHHSLPPLVVAVAIARVERAAAEEALRDAAPRCIALLEGLGRGSCACGVRDGGAARSQKRRRVATITPAEAAGACSCLEGHEKEKFRQRALYAASVCVGRWGQLIGASSSLRRAEAAAAAALATAVQQASAVLARLDEAFRAAEARPPAPAQQQQQLQYGGAPPPVIGGQPGVPAPPAAAAMLL